MSRATKRLRLRDAWAVNAEDNALGQAAYVPRLLTEWDLDAPTSLWQAVPSTCCFVDISGFTALSERLAQRGRIGAEELTEVLNHVFSRMLSVAYEKGGSLLKFGGDALFLVFTRGDHATLGAEAAVAMRAALREARTLPTSVGKVNLRMSVGLHTGELLLFRVGDIHCELIVSGPTATTTTEMESAADAGEILISADTAARLPKAAVGALKAPGRLLRWRGVVEGGPGPGVMRPVPAETVAYSIPRLLRDLGAEHEAEAEHRLATVGFVKFLGVDDLLSARGPDATAQALDAVVCAVQRAADAEGVTFLASDIDANGGKIILVAGVPAARDDDEGRMLRAARAILDQEYDLSVKIGVNRGHVFAGDIGAEFRRTFTVMGDTVNLAARLMAAARPGELYATAEVLERSRTMFATQTLEPFNVKGKSQPVQAYAVGNATGAQIVEVSLLPFTGRDEELAELRTAYRGALEGAGGVVVIEGDRGSGKSRLLQEFVRDMECRTLAIQGEAYAAATGYLSLRAPLRAMLGMHTTDPVLAGKEFNAEVTSRAPAHGPLAPLLAPVLDIELEPTPESDAIAIEFRRDRLADLLCALLESGGGPLVIVVDDAQWLDDASAGVLERVFSLCGSRPWLGIVARRQDPSGFRPDADVTLPLGPLDDATARELIDTVTAAAPLRPQERDQIVGRAAGNPLFLEELLRHARTSGFDALPETLDAVATREIDALPPAARRVVRYASVLGRVFDPALLSELLGVETIDRGLLRSLSTYLVPSEGQLQFRHALLQEAAYESLPFRTRVELHRCAGEAILELSAGDEADDALLSLHFFRAQDWERTWKSARVAGRQARDAYAPAEVATHLQRAIIAARRLGDVPPAEVSELLYQLAEAFALIGLYDKADDSYRRSAALVPDEPLVRAHIYERRAYIRGESQGRLTVAIRHLRAGKALVDPLATSDDNAARVRVQLLAREADIRYRQGRLRDAQKLCRRAMAEAERVDERRALAVAMDVLDSCLVEMGRPDEATHLPRVLELYEQLGDQLRVAGTLCNIGAISAFGWKWGDATDYFRLSSAAAARAGDLATAAIADGNLGKMLLWQGLVDEAERLLAPAVRTLESFDDVVGAALAMRHLGRARVFLGDHDGGLSLLRSAMTTLDDARVLVGSIEARAGLAEAMVMTGDYDGAAAAIAEARDLGREFSDTPLAVLLDRVEVTLTAKAGDTTGAIVLLPDAIRRARDVRAKYDLLFLLVVADRLAVAECRDAAEQTALARDLGVVRLAALPNL